MTRLGRLARGAIAKLPLPLTEAQFQKQVTDLAEWRGWEWVHFRPGRREDGSWYVPVEGPLGKGWLDLVLVRIRDRRLIFAELKSARGKLRADQERVLGALQTLTNGQLVVGRDERFLRQLPLIECYVWRPADWDDIERVLA